jgi:translocation and assembly module TamB
MKIFRIIRRLARYSLVAFLIFLLMVSALLWYITTDSFQQMVRRRLIASLEQATGGRVELGSFHAVPLRFEVEVRDLTIHGRESATARPLAHVDSMSAIVDLGAVLGVRMAFDRLSLVHPVVHIIYYPDGSTNQPAPKQSSVATFDQIFAISIRRLEVQRGELFLEEERIPVDFVSNDVEAKLDYSFLHRRYSGNISVGRAEAQFSGLRPFAWGAKTDFSIGHDEVTLRSFAATSEGSHLLGEGSISDFRHPLFKGSYELLLDLQQAAAIARQPRTTAGKLQLRGSATWAPNTYSTAGEFDLKDASWNDSTSSIRDLSASGKFALDPQKVSLTQVLGRVFRGSFSSELEVVNWSSPEKRVRGSKQGQQRGSAVVKVKDVSLLDLMAGLGPRLKQLQAERLAGSVSGSSEIRWKDSVRNAEVVSAISVTRSSGTVAGQLPVTATTQFDYQAGTASLQIDNLTASTPATRIRASGLLSKNSGLHLSVASDNVGEWTPLISAVFPQGLPIAVAGHAAFNGTIGGRFDNPAFSGNLQLNDFDTSVSQRNRASKLVHWDSLNTDLQLSANNLGLRNALFRREDATVRVDGEISLFGWNVQPGSAVHMKADIQNGDATVLETLTGQNEGATGRINAQLSAAGTISRPTGQAMVQWSNGSVRGCGFDNASATILLGMSRVTVQSAEIARAKAHVSGKGWYELTTGAFQGDISGKGFDIAEITALERSRVKVGGSIDFSAKASGTIEKPDVNAEIYLRNVTFNEEPAGNYLMNATTHGAEMHLTGHSESGVSEVVIDGNVRLRDLWPARVDFHFNHLDIDSFLESYLQGHITGHSAVAGDLVLQGPLRDPRKLSLTGNLSDVYAEVEKIKIRNDGPVQFTLTEQTLNINSLRLIGENTDFSLAGSMQLSGERQLNLRGSGKIGLQLVHTYDPDLTGSGSISGQVTATGTMAGPVVRGTLNVENAAIADVNLPSALSELNGTLQFSQNQITIEELTGRTGGGTVSFAGHAQLNGKQVNFDVTANADSVRLRYPPGVSSTATASLHWNGSTSGSLLSGDITVTRLGVTPGFDFGAYLARAIQQSSLPQTDPVLNNIRLDLHVVTAPDLQMQTSVLRLRGDADLRVRGNAAKPVLLGRADVFEGEAYFNGTKYHLERGGVTFGAPSANNAAASVPVVDLEATTHIRDYDITLSVTGPADHPKMNYRSEPPLPTNDIIGLLAFGQTTEESAALQQSNQSAFSQQASSAMLAAALNATLNNRTQRLFGNSRIKIDPQGLETETSPTQTGPAVTIEQQVKDNLTITYTTDVAQTSQQIIRAEYYISRNVSVVAIRDQNGVVSFDVKIRRRKR